MSAQLAPNGRSEASLVELEAEWKEAHRLALAAEHRCQEARNRAVPKFVMPSPANDATMFKAYIQWMAMVRHQTGDSEETAGAAWERVGEIEQRITDTPAVCMAGLAIKLRIAREHCPEWDEQASEPGYQGTFGAYLLHQALDEAERLS